MVLEEMFGCRFGTVLEEGLVDSSDTDDFEVKLESLLRKWHSLSTPSSGDIKRFIQWFVYNKVHVIRNTILHPIREDCGLGSPP